jgi:hypothetical protein
MDVDGDLTITTVNEINTGTVAVAGNVTSSDTSVGGTAALTLDGSGAQNIDATGSGDFPDGTFTINKATGGAVMLSDLTVALDGASQDLTITQGTLDLNGFDLTVPDVLTVDANGTLQLEGDEAISTTTTTLNAGSTVLYNGDGAYTGLVVGDTYSNVTFNGTGSWTLDAALDVNNDLTITSGTLITGGNNINVAGDWSNSGTFTHGSATVTLDGTNQAITGDSTFYDFNKTVTAADTLTYAAGSTTTIAALGTLTLDGDPSQLLSLRSGTPGTRWNLTLNDTAIKAIDYVDVQDSNASASHSSLLTIEPTNSDDSGNNLEWFTYIVVDDGNVDEWFDAQGTEYCIDDQGGADDWTNPSKLDITKFCVASNLADTFYVLFGYDDVSLTTPSTACVLIDTDDPSNDYINKVLCAVIDGASTSVTSVELYGCDDVITGGCENANLEKTYTVADYGFTNTRIGPFGNTDSFVEVALPFTDLALAGSNVLLTSLVSYPGKGFLKSPKDSIFDNYEDRITYNVDNGSGGTIAGPGNKSVSGVVYSDEGTTGIGINRTVRLLVKGISRGTDTTGTNGSYFISVPAANIDNNDEILVYVDGDDGAVDDGTTVTVFKGSDLPSVDIYKDHLITRHDNNAGDLTNALMKAAENGYGDTEILFDVDGSNNLTVEGSNTELYVPTGHTYVPGGNVDTVHAKIEGTWTATTTESYAVSSNWSNNGTFTAASSTVTLDGTGQAINGSTSFYNLTKSVTAADTLTFQDGQTTSIAAGGTATLNGTSGNILNLRSATPGTQWLFNVAGSSSVAYVDVDDSNALGGNAIYAYYSTDDTAPSNNDNWYFPGLQLVKQVWDETGTNCLASIPSDSNCNGSATSVTTPATGKIIFLIFIRNTISLAASDVRFQDLINDTEFTYQAGTMKRSPNDGTAPSDAANLSTIMAAATIAQTDAFDGDTQVDEFAGIDTGASPDDMQIGGAGGAGQNDILTIPANKTFAIRFEAVKN